jgi:hypothetical protein
MRNVAIIVSMPNTGCIEKTPSDCSKRQDRTKQNSNRETAKHVFQVTAWPRVCIFRKRIFMNL